jgi:hypothetical protein
MRMPGNQILWHKPSPGWRAPADFVGLQEMAIFA